MERLELNSADREIFVIHRSFCASPEKLWDLWTQPELLAQWLPSTGFNMNFIESDIRVGHSSFYRITDGEFVTLYGRSYYQELSPPHHLVYTQQFCDENGAPSRHPLAPTFPQTLLTTVTLAAENEKATRVTVIWEPQGKLPQEELEVFKAARTGMTQGWTGSFNKLEAMLG